VRRLLSGHTLSTILVCHKVNPLLILMALTARVPTPRPHRPRPYNDYGCIGSPGSLTVRVRPFLSRPRGLLSEVEHDGVGDGRKHVGDHRSQFSQRRYHLFALREISRVAEVDGDDWRALPGWWDERRRWSGHEQ
jgi:hypothetical protein